MIIMKFGGSSVDCADSIKRVCNIIAERRAERPFVIVSAMAKTTDALLRAVHAAPMDLDKALKQAAAIYAFHQEVAAALIRPVDTAIRALGTVFSELTVALKVVHTAQQLTPQLCDAALSCGELASSIILAASLQQHGMSSRWVDARAVIATDDTYGGAYPLVDATYDRVKAHCAALPADAVPVMGGFVGATHDGIATTLGRGGSDLSAALVGAALCAEEIQIWTDVDGVLSCDPRIYAEGHTIPRLSYHEAALLAQWGAKVLHPETMWPAMPLCIPITVRNSRRLYGPITVVTTASLSVAATALAVACKTDRALIRVQPKSSPLVHPAFVNTVRRVRENVGISEDCYFRFADHIAVIVPQTDRIGRLEADLTTVGDVVVHQNQTVVALIGSGLSSPSVLSKVLRAVSEVGDDIAVLASADSHLMFIVPQDNAACTVKALHCVLDQSPEIEAPRNGTCQLLSGALL